ncbi:5-methylcytosine-specific restriction endonuclease McrA [Clostridium beijerinckii]|uniref:HNH endonuclease n=1 Tax=Clostridium beijerinckii TaxID=1520 RepID=UPI00149471E8|nr:HNH endonuclease [Clostridium beijerinckii]NOW86764.1 5-methylcytosine-specific restriction endonuclease McrA [Clostridium beijerinckii]
MEKNFYKSSKWLNKRERVLKRDEYRCRECIRYGKSVTAVTVHHIIPLDQNPSLRLVSDNLLSLCNKCHDKMHDRTNNQLTKLGEEWVVRAKLKKLYFSIKLFK